MSQPYDRWLQATRACVDAAAEGGYALVSSLGSMQYNWVSFLAAKRKLPLILVVDGPIPAGVSDDYIRSGMGWFPGLFDPSRTLIISPFSEDSAPGKKLRGPIRDAVIASMSHALWVAEIRAGGVMEKVVNQAAEEGRRVSVFRPDRFDPQTAGNKRLLEKGSVTGFNPALRPSEPGGKSNTTPERRLVTASAGAFEGRGEYLFHFTRSCPGPWPGQSWEEYLSSLDNAEPGASHSALDTLGRIAGELRIRGGSRLIRGDQPMVSLTECAPQELTGLIAWNRSLIRWTFEPYGVAIRKDALERMGARRVIYASEDEYKALSPKDRLFFQLHNPPRTDWSREKEWRVRGDIDLSAFAKNEVMLVTPPEAFSLMGAVPFRVSVTPPVRSKAGW